MIAFFLGAVFGGVFGFLFAAVPTAEQVGATYEEAIREYAAENDELRELVGSAINLLSKVDYPNDVSDRLASEIIRSAEKLGLEVQPWKG